MGYEAKLYQAANVVNVADPLSHDEVLETDVEGTYPAIERSPHADGTAAERAANSRG